MVRFNSSLHSSCPVELVDAMLTMTRLNSAMQDLITLACLFAMMASFTLITATIFKMAIFVCQINGKIITKKNEFQFV